MATKRKIEVFSAGCPACQETVALVNSIACPSCDVNVLDMKDSKVASRAKSLGVRSVPAVVINGKLADCCTGRGPEEAALRAAGLGVASPDDPAPSSDKPGHYLGRAFFQGLSRQEREF